MSTETNNTPNNGSTTATAIAPDATLEFVRQKVTKKAVTADHPTWCPGCGDFAVLASYYKVIEKRQLDHEKIVTLAGIGCSSRFPYFRERLRRPLHSWPRCSSGQRNQPGPA